MNDLPFGDVDETLLAVDNNGIVQRLEVKALVSAINVEVGLARGDLGSQSGQDDVGAGGDVFDEGVLLGVDKGADRDDGQYGVMFVRVRNADGLLIGQSTTCSVADGVVLVETRRDGVVVKLLKSLALIDEWVKIG